MQFKITLSMTLNQKSITSLINQIFEIEKKSANSNLEKSLSRNFDRIKNTLENAGYRYHNPLGEKYDLTRLDCEAMISGEETNNLKIVEVIKPIIYWDDENRNTIIQKGVVITENN